MFVKWWKERSNEPPPVTIDDVIDMNPYLTHPVNISIKPHGKYTQVTGTDFEGFKL